MSSFFFLFFCCFLQKWFVVAVALLNHYQMFFVQLLNSKQDSLAIWFLYLSHLLRAPSISKSHQLIKWSVEKDKLVKHIHWPKHTYIQSYYIMFFRWAINFPLTLILFFEHATHSIDVCACVSHISFRVCVWTNEEQKENKKKKKQTLERLMNNTLIR